MSKNMMDELIKKIKEKNSPIVMGIDPRYEMIPDVIKSQFPKDMAGFAESAVIFAKKLIDEGIVINSREMKDNPLVSAIRFSNAFLVEELMKNYRNLIVTYSNEYVRNCSVLDIAERTKNEKIINIVKKYLV